MNPGSRMISYQRISFSLSFLKRHWKLLRETKLTINTDEVLSGQLNVLSGQLNSNGSRYV